MLADPFVSDWAVGADTGCVYGGELTVYVYRRKEVISVPAERTYQSRADEKTLEFYLWSGLPWSQYWFVHPLLCRDVC